MDFDPQELLRCFYVSFYANSEPMCEALAALIDSVEPEVDERLEIADRIYWAYSAIPEYFIRKACGLSEAGFKEAIKPRRVDVTCGACPDVICVLCEWREDYAASLERYTLCARCSRDRRRRLHAEKAAKEREAEEAAFLAKVTELREMSYTEYLRSPEWKERRDRQVEADGGACRVCGSTESLNVHHRTYERKGDEAPGDLITLCQPCHQLFHENGKLARP